MPPPTKRRKTEHGAVEEITFDSSARQEYLTGFHKRKLQRTKQAQEAAQKKARAERIEERKKLREERKEDLQRHVQEINAFLKPELESEDLEDEEDSTEILDEWSGISEPHEIDHEAEYIDEDRYTTVTVEALDVSREGLYKSTQVQEKDDKKDYNPEGKEADHDRDVRQKCSRKDTRRLWTKSNPEDKSERTKKKRKKFRYESKAERKVTRVKEKSKNSKQAKARREG